ncbi:DUF5672 family protein [Ideonella sp. DXS22W]|uniref:DUF5672 family protein n=1 Tax=Pseudaquabacterium inlustre TaxID=2984192 RepID=A0ABU9CE65_9BURK
MTALPPRLQLPDVTLVCVDTGAPRASLAALLHCMRQADFGDVLLFTDPMQVRDAPHEVRLRGLQLQDATSRTEFMLEELAAHVFTSHALVIQHDAFIADASQWHEDFLLYDYIGAPVRGLPASRAVGHGAFSLRSRRLLVALRLAAISPQAPDDELICQHHREHLERVHDIRFAPPDLAQRFARATPATPPASFGFQGLAHLAHVLPPEGLDEWLAQLPDALLQGPDGARLCAALLQAQQPNAAAKVLAVRRRDGRADPRCWHLRLRLAWALRHHRRQSGFHA